MHQLCRMYHLHCGRNDSHRFSRRRHVMTSDVVFRRCSRVQRESLALGLQTAIAINLSVLRLEQN